MAATVRVSMQRSTSFPQVSFARLTSVTPGFFCGPQHSSDPDAPGNQLDEPVQMARDTLCALVFEGTIAVALNVRLATSGNAGTGARPQAT